MYMYMYIYIYIYMICNAANAAFQNSNVLFKCTIFKFICAYFLSDFPGVQVQCINVSIAVCISLTLVAIITSDSTNICYMLHVGVCGFRLHFCN